MDDQTLITKLKQRDDDAMLALVEAYGRLIRQLVWQQLRTDYERGFTPDVENRVYYKVWQHIADYDPAKGSLATWLGTIAKHQAIDYARGLAATFATIDLDQVTVAVPPSSAADLTSLFSQLSPVEQQVFQLYFVKALTVKKIGKKLHMKQATIYQHLARGRKKLRQGGSGNGAFH